jgi:hypothetical protein
MTETVIPKVSARVNWTATERAEWLALFEKRVARDSRSWRVPIRPGWGSWCERCSA